MGSDANHNHIHMHTSGNFEDAWIETLPIDPPGIGEYECGVSTQAQATGVFSIQVYVLHSLGDTI